MGTYRIQSVPETIENSGTGQGADKGEQREL